MWENFEESLNFELKTVKKDKDKDKEGHPFRGKWRLSFYNMFDV